MCKKNCHPFFFKITEIGNDILILVGKLEYFLGILNSIDQKKIKYHIKRMSINDVIHLEGRGIFQKVTILHKPS